jgi:hypothetical protein
MLIRTVESFFGPDGERIERLTLVDAESGLTPTSEQIAAELKEPEPVVVLLGVILIPVGVHAPGPDGRPMLIDVRPQEVRFPIESDNLKDAYEKFPELAKQVVDDLRKKQEDKKSSKADSIIVPNAAQSEAINRLKLVTE